MEYDMIPHCLMWVILKERNNCTFNDVELSGAELKSLIVRLFEWAQTFGSTDACSVVVY